MLKMIFIYDRKLFCMKFLLIFCILNLIISCKRPVQYPEGQSQKKSQEAKESLVNINKYLVKRQQEIISAYAERLGWDMKTSETGLWYMIYEKGSGSEAGKDKIIRLDYSISLLDGTLCDKSRPFYHAATSCSWQFWR